VKAVDFLILSQTIMPAVLTENGFYTNSENMEGQPEVELRIRFAVSMYRPLMRLNRIDPASVVLAFRSYTINIKSEKLIKS
jgi:hypothetical protein